MITTQPDRSKIVRSVLPYQRTWASEIASMHDTLNADQILALAPDASSAKAGQSLAGRRNRIGTVTVERKAPAKKGKGRSQPERDHQLTDTEAPPAS